VKVAAAKKNAERRLVTGPYDVHATIRHLMHLNDGRWGPPKKARRQAQEGAGGPRAVDRAGTGESYGRQGGDNSTASLPGVLAEARAHRRAQDSACRLHHGKTFKGGDMQGGVTSQTVENCCRLCRGKPGCESFSYRESSKSCYLKNDAYEERDDPSIISGTVPNDRDVVSLGDRAQGGAGSDKDRADLAVGESAIKCPSPLNVLKDTYDHGCY
jgi:hypothetical protein